MYARISGVQREIMRVFEADPVGSLNGTSMEITHLKTGEFEIRISDSTYPPRWSDVGPEKKVVAVFENAALVLSWLQINRVFSAKVLSELADSLSLEWHESDGEISLKDERVHSIMMKDYDTRYVGLPNFNGKSAIIEDLTR